MASNFIDNRTFVQTSENPRFWRKLVQWSGCFRPRWRPWSKFVGRFWILLASFGRSVWAYQILRCRPFCRKLSGIVLNYYLLDNRHVNLKSRLFRISQHRIIQLNYKQLSLNIPLNRFIISFGSYAFSFNCWCHFSFRKGCNWHKFVLQQVALLFYFVFHFNVMARLLFAHKFWMHQDIRQILHIALAFTLLFRAIRSLDHYSATYLNWMLFPEF